MKSRLLSLRRLTGKQCPATKRKAELEAVIKVETALAEGTPVLCKSRKRKRAV